MKTANNYDDWVKVKSKKEIRALNPKNNDLIWYAGLCAHHKTHPSECMHHTPITLQEFFRRRNQKQRKKIKKVYYRRTTASTMGFWAGIQYQTQQNVAVIANFIVVLLVIGYIFFDIHSHSTHLPGAKHKTAHSDTLKNAQFSDGLNVSKH
ncbi:hypothetical protein [uncultured Microscilla sp.]|uniref:hypothetical protein n=1 Tax=uncultured Microscilla sp. TaxID=432653 RepID=UPI00262C0A53|nr:hypothetical protein [uncultured Microscilla sp.]